jgi:hypothetical protein
LACADDDKVSWKVFVFSDQKQVTNFDIFGLANNDFSGSNELDRHFVSFDVGLVALVVLETFSQHRNAKHEGKWTP